MAFACAPNDRIDRNADAEPPAPVGTGGMSPGTGGAAPGTGGTPDPGTGGAMMPPPHVACGEIMPWMSGAAYKEGDKVAAGRPVHVYECRPWPNSGWCPMAAYEPGLPGTPWADAWTDTGPCPTQP